MRTLGQFYREKILGRDDLTLRELPDRSGESNVVKDLFGWKLYSGKNCIECHSEEEARYLKVFFDAGMMEVKVPADQEYIKSIISELENLKTKIDEVISVYLDGVLSHKIKEKVRHEVYREIIS